MTTELIAPPRRRAGVSEVISDELDPASLEVEREAFTRSLVKAGAISPEFAASGALDRFALDTTTGIDAVSHILIGDSTGGCHHLRTVMDLGIEDRSIASEIGDMHRPERRLKSYKDEQKILTSGVYGANVVGIVEDGIEYRKVLESGKYGTDLEINSGSTMFPNEWSAQDVLEAILQVAETPVKSLSESGRLPAVIHDARVNDVRIQVVCDKQTGKIITAAPGHRGRYMG